MAGPAFLGIDIGTESARAGVFDTEGTLLGTAKQPIKVWRDGSAIVEQSTEDIWAAVRKCVHEAVAGAGVPAGSIAGIGVDATCSLAVVGPDGAPIAVGPSGDPNRNVIVWMDHRATGQADRINAGSHAVLRYVGGRISPEMQTPKLLWLKENRPDAYAAAGHFFDLSDYLTWRLTGSLARSVCTVTCKWTYLAHEGRWDPGYFESIGLNDLARDVSRIGAEIVAPGTPLGRGLSPTAAADLGLKPGIAVGAALIDAHAGGVGTVGARDAGAVENSLAYIFGTSACAMATTRQPTFVPGVWGPYFSSMIPDLWLNEAGQSAAGAAVAQLVEMHPASGDAKTLASKEGLDLVTWLEHAALAGTSPQEAARKAGAIHVVPDFNGNRSPFADPEARAIIAGIGTDRGIASLISLYVAGVCGVAYGLGQIVDALAAQGIRVERLIVSGGVARSRLARQILADATRLPVGVPANQEPVLLGAAMLGATASRHYATLADAMAAMSHIASWDRPGGGAIADFHRARADAYARLQDTERAIRAAAHQQV